MEKVSKVSNKAIILINLILAETFVFILTSMYIYFWFKGLRVFRLFKWEVFSLILLFLSITFSILGIHMVKEILKYSEIEAEAEASKVKIQDSFEMVDSLRSQRHDFINHLQVIYGLIQLGRPEKVEEYIKDISKGISTCEQSVSLAKPEVAAIIMNKTAQAEKNGIETSCEISTTMEDIKVSGCDLVGVFGNLMDNAIRALDEVSDANKKISISLYEKDQGYIFEIFNSAPIIHKDIQKKIFKKGFSTKEEDGHGYGLFIVKNLVEKNGGQITLKSEESYGTMFKVYLPINLEIENVC